MTKVAKVLNKYEFVKSFSDHFGTNKSKKNILKSCGYSSSKNIQILFDIGNELLAEGNLASEFDTVISRALNTYNKHFGTEESRRTKSLPERVEQLLEFVWDEIVDTEFEDPICNEIVEFCKNNPSVDLAKTVGGLDYDELIGIMTGVAVRQTILNARDELAANAEPTEEPEVIKVEAEPATTFTAAHATNGSEPKQNTADSDVKRLVEELMASLDTISLDKDEMDALEKMVGYLKESAANPKFDDDPEHHELAVVDTDADNNDGEMEWFNNVLDLISHNRYNEARALIMATLDSYDDVKECFLTDVKDLRAIQPVAETEASKTFREYIGMALKPRTISDLNGFTVDDIIELTVNIITNDEFRVIDEDTAVAIGIVLFYSIVDIVMSDYDKDKIANALLTWASVIIKKADVKYITEMINRINKKIVIRDTGFRFNLADAEDRSYFDFILKRLLADVAA
jgi:hypothetical protein